MSIFAFISIIATITFVLILIPFVVALFAISSYLNITPTTFDLEDYEIMKRIKVFFKKKK